MSKEFLHRMAYAAKEFGESVWVEKPDAILQFSVWTDDGVDEVVVGYTGERITAQIGHEDLETPEVFRRLRAEIDDDTSTGDTTDRE